MKLLKFEGARAPVPHIAGDATARHYPKMNTFHQNYTFLRAFKSVTARYC